MRNPADIINYIELKCIEIAFKLRPKPVTSIAVHGITVWDMMLTRIIVMFWVGHNEFIEQMVLLSLSTVEWDTNGGFMVTSIRLRHSPKN